MILWVVFDEEINGIILPRIVERIKRNVYAMYTTLESGTNNSAEKCCW